MLINSETLETILYIYSSKNEAYLGKSAGGTAFLVGIPSVNLPDVTYLYIITNTHVVQKAGITPTIRFNKTNGETYAKSTNASDWIYFPGNDLACAPISGNLNKLKYRALNISMFLTKELAIQNSVGIGDEIFVCGKFFDEYGKQYNNPISRFGKIALYPSIQIKHQHCISQETIIVDAFSIGGLSGSPVFLHIPYTPGRPGQDKNPNEKNYLLGINYGHIPIPDFSNSEKNEMNSGFMCVIPAWIIHDMLFQPSLVIQRDSMDKNNI